MAIDYSSIESDIFQLKAGRAHLKTTDIAPLKTQIIRSNYDICRIKTNTDQANLITSLQQLPFPVFFGGALLRYRINFKQHRVPTFRKDKVDFELYDGSQYDTVAQLFSEIFDQYALNFYKVHYLDALITNTQARKCLLQYFTQNFKENPKKKLWLVKEGGKYGGILAAKFWNDSGDAVLAGVTPDFRRGMLYRDIIRFIQQYCVDNNVRWGYTGARFHQTVVQKFVTRESMRVHQTQFIFYLTSFLSHSSRSAVTKDIKLQHLSNDSSLLNKLLAKVEPYLPENCQLSNVKNTLLQQINSSKTYQLLISFPVLNSKQNLILTRLYDKNETLCCLTYFAFKNKT